MDKDFNFKSIIYELPRNVLKFLTNACIDTLPTNSNLNRWKKRNSPNCQLCGNRETLLHVLNNCRTMLDQGRYTWRHNSVLNYLFKVLKPTNPTSPFEIFCDLSGKMTGISTIPTDILVTSQKPDIVIVNKSDKSVFIIELTIPFDRNIDDARKRKEKRYENLNDDICKAGFSSHLYTIEIGSRGFVSSRNMKTIKDILNIVTPEQLKSKDFKNVIKDLEKIAIISSYITFHSKYEQSWTSPQLIEL